MATIWDLIRLQELKRNKCRSPKRRDYTNSFNEGLTQLWYSNLEKEWENALTKYWECVRPENVQLEIKMEHLNKEETSNSYWVLMWERLHTCGNLLWRRWITFTKLPVN